MEFVLDIAKWRSGGDDYGDYIFGEGTTQLLNEEGYMCCLGQFSQQLGVNKKKLLNRSLPQELKYKKTSTGKIISVSYNKLVGLLLDKHKQVFDGLTHTTYCDSELTGSLVRINDNEEISPTERVNEIRAILEENGHTLVVKNENLLDKSNVTA